MTTPMKPYVQIHAPGGWYFDPQPPLPETPEPMVERTLACPLCKRVFCRVFARPSALIDVQCDGCEREGRR